MKEILKQHLKESGTALFVDIKAIEENYHLIQSKAPNAEMSWVLKANAYGLGIENILPLVKKLNCKHIFVATLQEGKEIRNLLGEESKINLYVLNPILPIQEKEFYDNKLIPVLNTLYQVKHWHKFAQKRKENLASILHIESGINRMALTREEVIYLYENKTLLENMNILYIMSHFACASILKKNTMEEQYKTFLELIQYLPKSKYSLAASDAIFVDDKYSFDLIRPAVGLYGALIADLIQQPTKNVIYFYSTIQQVKHLNVGEKVGYGYLWEAKRPSKIAILPVGYADGIPRSLKKGLVSIGGIRAPIIGCVSMDLITVDITDLPESLQKEGQIVELIGNDISLEEFTSNAESLDCNVLCMITKRFPRIFDCL